MKPVEGGSTGPDTQSMRECLLQMQAFLVEHPNEVVQQKINELLPRCPVAKVFPFPCGTNSSVAASVQGEEVAPNTPDNWQRTRVEDQYRKYFMEIRKFSPFPATLSLDNLVDFVLWHVAAQAAEIAELRKGGK